MRAGLNQAVMRAASLQISPKKGGISRLSSCFYRIGHHTFTLLFGQENLNDQYLLPNTATMKTVKKILPPLISFIFVVLFAYTVISKGVGFSNYLNQLEQSPRLEGYGEPLAYGIITLQTFTVILLCYRPLRLWGLWITFGTLAVFAGYIGGILLYSKNPPCTCIGLLEKMTWKDNLVLNIGLMITALTGIMTMKAGGSK